LGSGAILRNIAGSCDRLFALIHGGGGGSNHHV
jgi:hypothetical protein